MAMVGPGPDDGAELDAPWWGAVVVQGVWVLGGLIGLVVVSIAADSMAHAFAGRTTNVNMAFGASIAVNLVGVAAVIGLLLRTRVHRRAAERERKRNASLEDHIESLRGQQQVLPMRPPPP